MAKTRVSVQADLEHVRNIGIAAHVDAGKTTLTERVLFYTGALHRIGEVHEGAAHMDFMAEEKAHGITITSAVTKCPWKDHLIQIVDTPGHVDFTIEVERAMRVLDGAVIVMDAVRGVEPQTETVWRQASRFDIPRLVFVNKMDRPGASYKRCLDTLRKRLRAEPVPVAMPTEDGIVVDLVSLRAWRFQGEQGEEAVEVEIPAGIEEEVQEHRETLLLACAEVDEELAEAVLMEEEVDPEAVWAALRKLTLARKVHPVFGGSALRNYGVQVLLDGVLRLLPAPLERPASIAHTLDGEEELVEMVADGPLAALAFKIQLWEGRRHVFARIYRGRLAAGDSVRIAGHDQVERVARIFDVDAGVKTRLDEAQAGQIVLFAGLRHASTGDTLCALDHEILLASIEKKEPVLGLAIEPESASEEEKMLEVLAKVCEEDPTLRFEDDADTGQRVLKGMGELHLSIVFERIEREFGLKIRAGRPRVMSRETVAGNGSGEHLVDRTIRAGDKEVPMKARAVATVRALPRDAGMVVKVEPRILPVGVVPTPAQLDAIKAGTMDSTMSGPSDGAPLQDVEVILTEVELYETASSPTALRIACSQAVRAAIQAAGGQVLRPLMKVEVVVPDENMGSVLGDLQARRASILGQESDMGTTSIQGECPLEALLGYTTALRSLTSGRGQFTMEFARFDVG